MIIGDAFRRHPQEHIDVTDITVNIPLSDLPEVLRQPTFSLALDRVDCRS